MRGNSDHNTKYKALWIALGAIAVGVGLIYLGAYVRELNSESSFFFRRDPPPWCDAVRDLGITVLLAGLVGIFFELAAKSDFLSIVMERAGIAQNISDAGITGVFKIRRHVPFEALITSSTSIHIVIAYSNAWVKEFRAELQEFLKSPDHKIILYLPNPDNLTILQELCIRFPDEPISGQPAQPTSTSVLQARIKQTTGDFISLLPAVGARGEVKILYMDRSPMYSAYIFDRMAILQLFKHRAKRTETPYIQLADGWFFEYIVEDVDQLQVQSVVVFPAQPN